MHAWVSMGGAVPIVACHSSQNVLWQPAFEMASAAVVSKTPLCNDHFPTTSLGVKPERREDTPTPFWDTWVVTSGQVL